MSTTGLVMTVTDELMAELEQQSARDPSGAFPVRYAVISEITAELRRLRAENAELAQSLAESRANDQAAMGWLTSLRWASGDRGERMLPELVTHIESLAKDAGRYRHIRSDGIPDEAIAMVDSYYGELELVSPDRLDTAIDTAMATQ